MIKLLEKKVADKIAAGEVVDRPLSVVKELVENSIDAGADAVVVEIKKGGKTYIRVSDTGCGINADEVTTAFKRHATSKITEAEDLDSIRTLGFRGEALASIAAVSRTELITKTADAKTGTSITVEGGETAGISAIGCDSGTTVIVRDLFYNVPARYKFMKSDSAEAGLITEFVSQMALAYPDIRFKLINNEAIQFLTQGRGDRYNSILTIYSKDIGKSLVPVEYENGEMKLEGYVSNVGESRNSRKNQIFFVNGRVVSSKVMDTAVKNAYKERLFMGRFPIAFLFLAVKPDTLDVNIHPNKKEIRFDDEKSVELFVTEAIKQALATKEAAPTVNVQERSPEKPVNKAPAAEKQTERPAAVQKPEQEPKPEPQKVIIAEKPEKGNQLNIKELLSTMREESEIRENTGIIKPAVSRPFEFSTLTIKGSVFATYIIAEYDSDMYLIDQHAAHERIFYEKLIKQFETEEKLHQPVLMPAIFTLPVTVTDDQWLDVLSGMGYTIEPFGERTYRITEIPMFMELSEAENFVKDFISSIDEETDLKSQKTLDKLASKACKSAVKGNDNLNDAEIAQLIKDLEACDNPFSCPHGRPTFIRLGRYQIERMFKRV